MSNEESRDLIREEVLETPELREQSLPEKKRAKKPKKSRKPKTKRPPLGTIGATVWGAVGGMGLFAGFFGFSLYMYSGFAVMDVKNQEVEKIVMDNYLNHILWYQLKILLTYLGIGGFLGGLFGMFGGGFAVEDKRHGRIYCLVCGLLGALSVQIAMITLGLGNTPALYSKWFHDAGFPWANLQAVTTVILIPPIMKTIMVLLIFLPVYGIFKKALPALGGYIALLGALVIFALWLYAPNIQNAGVSLSNDPARPNVLILASDSIRPDRLGCYGHFRNTSPHIDELAEDSLRFEQVFVPLARTFPSVASMLTGQYPHTHGIRNMFPSKVDTFLRGSMAGAFNEAGYRTAAIGDYAADIFPRMEAGFQATTAPDFSFVGLIDTASLQLHFMLLPYLDNRLARKLFPVINAFSENADPDVLTGKLIDYLNEEPGKPFFCHVFYSPTHFPYATHYPYYKMFAKADYMGPFKYKQEPAARKPDLDADDIYQVRALFDGAIAAFDEQVARMVTFLKARGVYDNTIIIVTSDHGENLYEVAQDIGHGDHFRYGYTNHVPLVIHWPAGIGKIGRGEQKSPVKGIVSQIDIAPTLLANLGLTPPAKMDGKDFTDLALGKVEKINDDYFAETGLWFVSLAEEYLNGRRIPYPDITEIGNLDFENGWIDIKAKYQDITNIAKHRMASDGQFKAIYMPTQSGVRYECYDTVNDPQEQYDIFADVLDEDVTDTIAVPLDENWTITKGEKFYTPVGKNAMSRCLGLRRNIETWLGSAPGVEMKNHYAMPVE